ncbi:MAG: hypothetical protein K2Y32_11650 [Candidatus Obscuribacterales bacterium]|nr:hypothetical protein [Candidatus Obscuribacterales bacterium]
MQNQTVLDASADASASMPSMEALMGNVLKAHRPLKELSVSLAQTQARENLRWQTFKSGELPAKNDRKLIAACVERMLGEYCEYLVARNEHFGVKAEVLAAEDRLNEAVQELAQAALTSATAGETNAVIAGASHLVTLGKGYKSLIQNREQHGPMPALKPLEALEPGLAEKIVQLKEALIEALCVYVQAIELQKTLEPVARELYGGTELHKVQTPVRPIEEEVQRYLSELEARVKWRRSLHAKIYPLCKERLECKAALDESQRKLQTTLADEQFQEPAMSENGAFALVHGVKSIKQHLMPNMRKELGVLESYFYTGVGADNPEHFDSFSRATATAVEKDQIDFLRKQFREVAFAMGHRNEAQSAYNAHPDREIVVSCREVTGVEDFAGLLVWHESYLARSQKAELENHQNRTKAQLLKDTIEHWEEKTKEEMVKLYKGICAMLPREIASAPKPCDELRDLINTGAYIAKPLDGGEANYPVY